MINLPILTSLFGLISAMAALLWRASTLVEKLRLSQEILERTLGKLEREVEAIRVLPQVLLRLETLEDERDMLRAELRELWKEMHGERH